VKQSFELALLCIRRHLWCKYQKGRAPNFAFDEEIKKRDEKTVAELATKT